MSGKMTTKSEETGTYYMTENVHASAFDDGNEIERANGEVLLFVDTNNLDKTPNLSHLKLAKDKHTVLVPQPSDDPADPLNWPSWRKHALLLLVAWGAFCGDFASTCGIAAAPVQAKEWAMNLVIANYPNNLSALMCGISGLLWMPLLNSWGRAPVLFWSTLLGFFFTLGCALSPTYEVYYGMRILQTVNASTGQTIGLAFIRDMFFFHEHARKIGIWYTIFIASPFCGPLFGNIMVAKLHNWPSVFWLTFGIIGLLLLAIVALADEPYYNRDISTERQPPRTASTRIFRILGVWQVENRHGYFPGVWQSYRRLLRVLIKPIIPLTMVYYSAIYMWNVGIVKSAAIIFGLPQSQGGYGLSQLVLGLAFFTPVVGVFVGEAFGHWFNDWIADRYVRKHNGVFVPEARLTAPYVGAVLMIPGLVLLGQALEKHLNIAAVIMGWGLYSVGLMITSVATVAYILDCYPSASGEVSALVNFARVALGFSVGYYQQEWGLKVGFDASFGTQAAIVAAAFIVLALIQCFGGRIRVASGPVKPLVV
ncbi:hypothetical protein PV04_10658 [Phialophora macrospora]|uniref:Major facilitator superfamily (MFS) profile domain-containing protein n=1 Tax=Phialophora macrospora TaxID=1851006 RepID=A0A0D2F6C0_9EURO|nr:hypothetical protein PV04_10658 [Phialophora macrospora]